MPLHIYQNTQWKEAKVHIYQGGVWKTVKQGYVYHSGVWKPFYTSSDPQTFTFPATDSASFRNTNKWRSAADGVYNGSWDFGDHIGCVAVDWAAVQAQSAIRPVVTKTEVYLYRRSGHGSSSAQRPTLWSLDAGEVGAGNTLVKGSTPGIDNEYHAPASLAWDQGGWFNLDNAIGQAIADGDARGFATCNGLPLAGSSLGGGGQDSDYMIFDHHSGSNPPQLRLTLDYS